MLPRERTVLTLIYPRRPAERQVLLGLKKRGFGEGKLNGFGGKLEAGETVEQSASRELREEACLIADACNLRWCGTMTYIYDTKPKAMEVNVYDVERWVGEPQETEEMVPTWFEHSDIPLQQMWADDSHWLVQYLDGSLPTPFVGRFRFKGHEGPDSWIVLEHSLVSLAPAPYISKPSFDVAAEQLAPGAALVVSTVCFTQAPGGSALPLESFIRYHLLRGFVHILIFIDDPADSAALAASRKFPAARVSVRVRGATLLEEQRQRCASFDMLGPLHDEVSARQMLDAELAMLLAPELGCAWVICLDSDELFYTAEASVAAHFESLVDKGVEQMTYLNHEAVPETMETADYFATTTLFRRHHFAVPLSAEAQVGLRFWMDRSSRGQYLLFYDNGKSACRSGIAGARPLSQHLWQLPSGRRSCTALADPRRMDIEGYLSCADPCILHFPVCGFSWLQAKYKTLGDFPDAWLGGKVKLPASFHSDCREACAAGNDALETLFRREVLLDNSAESSRQIACGVCLRITGHVQLLESVPDPTRQEIGEKKDDSSAIPPPETITKSVIDGGPQGIERGWILSKSMDWL